MSNMGYPVPITERETVEYAMKTPDMIRVNLQSKTFETDRRDEYWPHRLLERGASS